MISSDAARDIALLKVSAVGALTVLPFATAVREGDEVVALGHPLNLSGSMTITKGIVSAFRTIRGVSYIQTDAAINPGNSGGPLLNTNGEIVGMNTSVQRDIQGEDYSAQGIGFAIKFDVLSNRLTAMKAGQSSPHTPVATPAVVATQTPGYVFGPESGWLDANSNDGNMNIFDSQTNIDNFVVDVTFRTPDKTSEDYWTPWLVFRADDPGIRYGGYLISFLETGYWLQSLIALNTEQSGVIDQGWSPNFITSPNKINHIRLVVRQSEGWLFINGQFEAELNLNGLTASGTVAIWATASQGIRTHYSGFTVRPLRHIYGPRGGSIQHSPNDEFIDTQRSFTSVTDGIFEAKFDNPYASWQGNWSNGLMIRRSDTGGFHIVAVEESGLWLHDLRSDGTDPSQQLAEQYSGLISTTSGGDNHIRIIALGDEGWLFVNGVYIDKLDLSSLTQAGEVSAVTNYFTDDGIAGYSTRFEDFTIWSAD